MRGRSWFPGVMVAVAIVPILAGGAILAGTPQAEQAAFEVGGKKIVLPPPAPDLVEVGAAYRPTIAPFVGTGNRLVAGFLPREMIPNLRPGYAPAMPVRYAVVMVPEGMEFNRVGAEDFKELVRQVEQQGKRFLDDVDLDEAVKDVLGRSREAGTVGGVERIRLGGLQYLGILVKRPRALSLGFTLRADNGMMSLWAIGSMTMVLVKERFVGLVLYHRYTGKKSVEWLRTTTERWVDAVLAANAEP